MATPLNTAYIVIREHCTASEAVGSIVFLEAVEPPHPMMFLRCTACQRDYSHNAPHALLAGKQAYHPFAWLKPLPPVEEDVREEEEISA